MSKTKEVYNSEKEIHKPSSYRRVKISTTIAEVEVSSSHKEDTLSQMSKIAEEQYEKSHKKLSARYTG